MLMNMCQQITGAALSAYLPTLLSENGFEGATAQIATLAPYGSAAVVCPTGFSFPTIRKQKTDKKTVHDHSSKAV
jgi:hypothetical protein